MADVSSGTPSPLDDLWALRNRLVQYRRDAASDRADLTAGVKLKNLQEQIEAVDRAIADEQKPLPSIFDRALV
jgi:hypothetical protein